jgi:hypothetical protein
MEATKSLVIIDNDGTVNSDFLRDDSRIMSKIFESKPFISQIDKFLCHINSLDFFKNDIQIFDLRCKIYSKLSSKELDSIKHEYGKRYQNLLRVSLPDKEKILNEISKKYTIILVTSNPYAVDTLKEMLKYEVIFAPDFVSRKNQIIEKVKYHTTSYIIGNNYKDDIILARHLNIPSIYVGSSALKGFFKANFNVKSLNDVVSILRGGS